METPLTDKIHAQINRCGGTSEAAFLDILNHARQMERECAELRDNIQIAADRIDELKLRAEHWCDRHTLASNKLGDAESVLRKVLNGGIDDGLTWDQVMDMVRDIVKPNDKVEFSGRSEASER